MDPKNPFAILRLPSNASVSEIRAAGQLARIKLRLADPESANAGMLKLVELAIDQLQKPVENFKAGIEWPALGPDAAKILKTHPLFDDVVTNPMKNRTEAIEMLMAGESDLDKDHIRGVFFLMQAHAIFTAHAISAGSTVKAAGLSDWKPKIDLERASHAFSQGFACWMRAIQSPKFWLGQRLRAREMNDPRLNAEFLQKCEKDAVANVLTEFVQFAVEALKRRDASTCRRVVEGLQKSGGEQTQINRALERIYEPMCNRVAAVIETLDKKLNVARKQKLVGPFRELLDEYTRDIKPDVDLMIQIGDLPGTSEERTRDLAASFLDQLATAGFNQANAIDFSYVATEAARYVASSTQLIKKLDGELKLIKQIQLRIRLKSAFENKRHSEIVSIIDILLPIEDEDQIPTLQRLRAWAQAAAKPSVAMNLGRDFSKTLEKSKSSGCLIAFVTGGIVVALFGGAVAAALVHAHALMIALGIQ